MARCAVIRLAGNAIDVSTNGRTALPPEMREILEPQLRYTYIKILRGQEAWDFAGQRKPVKQELRLLYTYDKYGRLVCGSGFLDRVTKLLTVNGFTVVVEDCNAIHPRADRFKQDWDNVVRNFTFRVRQDEILLKVAAEPRGIVEAPTGVGKTFLYKAIGLLFPHANIVIITRRKDILQGIRMELSKDLPNIGQVGGGMKKVSRITVCTADSLHRLDPDRVDILIGEEVHELAAASYSQEIAKFRYCRMYGFSADPKGRLDNADMKLESLFGPIIFKMTYPEAVSHGLVVPIRVRWIDVTLPNNPCAGLRDIPRNRHGLWRNTGRNQLIANAARGFNDDEQVLIMVTTFEHAVYLRQFLPEFTLCYAERADSTDFDRYVGNGRLPVDEPVMTNTRRQLLRQQFEQGTLKKVIATDVWSTGVSFDSLSVLIRGDARSSPIMDSQIPGRVCRIDTAKTVGLVIDCLDQFDPGFREAARIRRRHYESKEWEQDLPRFGRLAT